MSSIPNRSSGSNLDAAEMDEKKRKRMLSNRESARRSRLKKQKQMEDMVNEISYLQRRIRENNRKCDILTQNMNLVQAENNELQAEKTSLSNYLTSLESMIMNYKQSTDCPCEPFPESFPEPCRQPWQVGGPMQPIMSSGMFKFY